MKIISIKKGRKQFLLLGIIFFLVIALALTTFLSQQPQELRKKAVEPKANIVETQKQKPEYAPGQILVKLSGLSPKPRVREEKKNQGIDFDKKEVAFEDIDSESLPSFLADRGQKNKIYTIEKVFKETQSPQEELAKFKQEFAQEISAGKRIINEAELIKLDLSRTFRLTFDKNISVESFIQELAPHREIEYAEPNYLYKAHYIPDDPYYLDAYPNNTGNRDLNWNPSYDYQWNLKKINMEKAWDAAAGNANIIVGVIDTGIDYTHTEFGACTLDQVNNSQCPTIVAGYDFVNNDNDPRDDHGHGSHVSGIIAGLTNNSLGIAGISGTQGKIRIMPMKGLDQNGSGWTDILSNAVVQAAQNGAKVINMSYGNYTPYYPESQTEKEALDTAYNLGTILVASAGNSNGRKVELGFWPANDEKVIAVGASDENDDLALYSNIGEKIEVVAPGGKTYPNWNIISLNAHDPANPATYLDLGGFPIDDGFLRLAGTSMASPHVAGLASLLLTTYPLLTPDRVRDIMVSSAEDLGDSNFDIRFGYGRINAEKALLEANTLKAPPRAKITNPNPEDKKIYNKSIEIIGSSSGDQFKKFILEWSPVANTQWSAEGITFAPDTNDGKTPVSNGSLGTWNPPTTVPAGKYTLRLTTYADSKTAFSTVSVNYDPSIKAVIEVPCGYPYEASSPVVADINNDGKQEILSVCRGNLYVYSSEGELLFTKTAWEAVVTVGELDPSYPGREIVVFQDGYADSQQTRWTIMAWHGDGTPVSGNWPRNIINTPQDARTFPNRIIIEDLNKDSSNDIVIVESSGDLAGSGRYHGSRIHALEANGNDLVGFTPFNTPRFYTAYTTGFHSEQFVTDVTNDTYPDIVSREMFTLSVFDRTGSLVWKLEDTQLGPVAVGDLDNDGKNEIVASFNFGQVKFFKWNGTSFASQKIYELPGASETYGNGIYRIQLLDYNDDGKPELLLELHKAVSHDTLRGFFKYVILDDQGNILSGFPGTPDINFPSEPVGGPPRNPWYDYPVKWDSYQSFIPTNVTYGRFQDQKIFAYEAMTFYNNPSDSTYMPDTYLEVVKGSGSNITRLPGFPKKIRNHWEICPWSCSSTYLTPIMADIDNDGKTEVVASVDKTSQQQGFTIYIYSLDNLVSQQDWPQYLYDERHTGAYVILPTATPTITPSPSPSATPTSTPTPSVKVTPTRRPTPTAKPKNNVPVVETTSLNPGKLNVFYQGNIIGYDADSSDTLSMSVTNLPKGIRVKICNQYLKTNRKYIDCRIEGTPNQAGASRVNINLRDNKRAGTRKVLNLTISP